VPWIGRLPRWGRSPSGRSVSRFDSFIVYEDSPSKRYEEKCKDRPKVKRARENAWDRLAMSRKDHICEYKNTHGPIHCPSIPRLITKGPACQNQPQGSRAANRHQPFHRCAKTQRRLSCKIRQSNDGKGMDGHGEGRDSASNSLD
jgi:hypothetical protein